MCAELVRGSETVRAAAYAELRDALADPKRKSLKRAELEDAYARDQKELATRMANGDSAESIAAARTAVQLEEKALAVPEERPTLPAKLAPLAMSDECTKVDGGVEATVIDELHYVDLTDPRTLRLAVRGRWTLVHLKDDGTRTEVRHWASDADGTIVQLAEPKRPKAP